MDITEIQDELLRLEYPNLLPDHDPDIERYYYLRSIGQSKDALVIYQNRLAVRYPNNEFRTWLLRSYRSHDPAFRSLLARGYRMLGARSLERVKSILLIIAEKAESFNTKDVYSTIRTAEEILQFLSPERYEAVAGMERYLRYATVLDLKIKSIAKATELVRSYLTDTLSVVEQERRRRMNLRRRAEEENRKRLVKADWDSYYYQKKYGVQIPFIDLSAVVFSEDDLARIEIPPFRRVEDSILGYCIKYWNMVDDPAFERILFLYSRKYGKKNYDVYMTIRRGKMAKRRDDEILASIMSILITGYYYSIQGDLYLQRNWNAIKYALANQGQIQALPAPKALPSPKALPPPSKKARSTRAKKQAEKEILPSKPEREQKEEKPAAAKQKEKKIIAKPIKRAIPKKTQEPSVPAERKSPAKTKKLKQTPRTLPKIAPKPKVKTAPIIAPRTQTVRPAAVVARPAEKRPVRPAPVKPVKVPKKLKPVEQPKTTIVPRPVQPVQPRPTQPVQPRPTQPVQPRPTQPVQPRPTQPVQPRPAQPVQPRPAQPVQPRPTQPVQPRPTQPVQPQNIKPAVVRPAVVKPAVGKSAERRPPKHVSAPPRTAGYRPAPFTPKSPPPERKAKVFTNKTLGKAKGSVSDRLKELSGHSYDVYEDRFLSKARSSIRKVLGTGRGLFFTLPEEAEDLVYNFLRDHYSDPYMDWEDSADKKNLLAMGFDLSSLNPVIEECYRAL